MSWHLYRAVERLEKRLDETEDPDEVAGILEELRALERELREREQWEEAGGLAGGTDPHRERKLT